MPRPPKLVTVAVRNGSVVRKDGRSFHAGHELACTVAEATSFYLAGAAHLPGNAEDARLVRTRVTAARAEADRRRPPKTQPETVEDPADFVRPVEREPMAAVSALIAPPRPFITRV